jgi:hypothetical protein
LKFDPLTFEEELGDIPGSLVHEACIYHLTMTKDEFWVKKKIADRATLSKYIPEMVRQYIESGVKVRPPMPTKTINPDCKICRGRGTTKGEDWLDGHGRHYPTFPTCACVVFENKGQAITEKEFHELITARYS